MLTHHLHRKVPLLFLALGFLLVHDKQLFLHPLQRVVIIIEQCCGTLPVSLDESEGWCCDGQVIQTQLSQHLLTYSFPATTKIIYLYTGTFLKLHKLKICFF